MIYEALIVPQESPTTEREVKRALLTYDKVILADPADRDFMPSNAVMSAISGLPIFGFAIGPARLMAKARDYDEAFQELMDTCKPALDQGLVEVRSTYSKAAEGHFTIGAVDLGGYPLNPQFVFWLYRSMASDQEFLREAIAGTSAEQRRNLTSLADVERAGSADGGINNLPALPELNVPLDDETTRTALTHTARGRIGAIIKYSGYCEARDLIPVVPQQVYGSLVRRILSNASKVLRLEEDPHWFRRNRVLRLCHEEFLPDDQLDALSIEQTIGLRTRAWGEQAMAREQLFASIFAIAQEAGDEAQFDDRAAKMVAEYRRESAGLLREREKLGLRIKCEIGAAALAGGSAVGLLSQIESPLAGMGATLAAAGIWIFDRAKTYGPALLDLRNREADMRRGAGYGIHTFFSAMRRGALQVAVRVVDDT